MKLKNFLDNNENLTVLEELGPFKVFQHDQDRSVAPSTAQVKYYMSQMDMCPKQCFITVNKSGIRLQKGAMQMMLGNVQQTTGVKGAADLFGKAIIGKMSGESAIKPEYTGKGYLITEPTYKYLLLEDLDNWDGGIVVEDGMFYACEATVKDDIQTRSSVGAMVSGKEGLFNLVMKGTGIVCLESWYPREELYEVVLENDVIKIDGNNAVCWSASLDFTVERSGKTLMGSAASGEGLVNVYRGTGRMLIAPRV